MEALFQEEEEANDDKLRDDDCEETERTQRERVERFLNDDLNTAPYREQSTPIQVKDTGGLSEALARTMLRNIPTGNGDGGAPTLLAFCNKLEMAAEQARLTSKEALTLAVNRLTGDAATLWLSHAKEHPRGDHRRWSSWEDLQEELRSAFYPQEHAQTIIGTLVKLTQSVPTLDNLITVQEAARRDFRASGGKIKAGASSGKDKSKDADTFAQATTEVERKAKSDADGLGLHIVRTTRVIEGSDGAAQASTSKGKQHNHRQRGDLSHDPRPEVTNEPALTEGTANVITKQGNSLTLHESLHTPSFQIPHLRVFVVRVHALYYGANRPVLKRSKAGRKEGRKE
ncbi:MAG: hypothetical protein BJ554DRAFT_6963 [Olpidium bornovanus]|uniref:Retrotransposon gag domain-containing protein n=1 Tax=Olpidium bornovanus TaxID=278681 RepID=A0A8H7ZWS7_9FUNG|nr:MAG: hypothetical protein BJ554DRAFT_6963 [Olpidium bornovanus]